jgi:hypothetical protein
MVRRRARGRCSIRARSASRSLAGEGRLERPGDLAVVLAEAEQPITRSGAMSALPHSSNVAARPSSATVEGPGPRPVSRRLLETAGAALLQMGAEVVEHDGDGNPGGWSDRT